MRKKDLLDFIERVEIKAVSSVDKRYGELIRAEKEKAINKYTDKLNVIQDTFNRASSNLKNLLADMKEDLEVAYQGDYSINSSLRTVEDLKPYITCSCDYKGQVQKLRDEQQKECKAVKDNYHKVYVVAQNMRSAKDIAKYLKELGFDISSVEPDDVTALVADIDKSKLFVCGDNK